MQVRFTASQSLELIVTEQPIPIQHYLRQPQRLVRSLVDPQRIDPLGLDRFRLKMRPLNFMTLTIQPTVDLKVWADATGAIHLQSTGSEIRGVDYINRRFHLNLVGRLMPCKVAEKTLLVGRADLEVQVELPPAFWMTPRPLLEATGNGLLRGVLQTVKQRLMHQLLADYQHWATAQTDQVASDSSHRTAAILPANGSVPG